MSQKVVKERELLLVVFLNNMNIEEFNYDLPEELIAQTPLENRSASRLMVVDKKTGKIKHETFKNIVSYFNVGDTLVLNDTKVLPARLIGEKENTNAIIEVLLLKDLGNDTWDCIIWRWFVKS